jgi:hypothetical protein
MNSNKDELQLIISKSKEELNKIKRAEYLIKNKLFDSNSHCIACLILFNSSFDLEIFKHN